MSALITLPFRTAILRYRSGSALHVDKAAEGAATNSLTVIGTDAHGNRLGRQVFSLEDLAPSGMNVPPWIQRVGPNDWFDSEAGIYLSTAEVRSEYGAPLPETSRISDWLTPFAPPSLPTFIETNRLDLYPRRGPSDDPWISPRRRGVATRNEPAIIKYVERIAAQISEAKQASLARSQQADRRFAARALDKARVTVQESALRKQYESIAALHHELHANGLTEEAIEVEFPAGRTNPTERRILNVFLEDWREKLAPLLPVHQKIQVLRAIVGGKLQGKSLSISPRGQLQFTSQGGHVVSVESLSSGEQHMLALFSMLLFTAAPGALVLIDEPEISLHAAWKHSFLDDLERVSAQTPLTVVAATHSTALINSRWELVEELGFGDE